MTEDITTDMEGAEAEEMTTMEGTFMVVKIPTTCTTHMLRRRDGLIKNNIDTTEPLNERTSFSQWLSTEEPILTVKAAESSGTPVGARIRMDRRRLRIILPEISTTQQAEEVG